MLLRNFVLWVWCGLALLFYLLGCLTDRIIISAFHVLLELRLSSSSSLRVIPALNTAKWDFELWFRLSHNQALWHDYWPLYRSSFHEWTLKSTFYSFLNILLLPLYFHIVLIVVEFLHCSEFLSLLTVFLADRALRWWINFAHLKTWHHAWVCHRPKHVQLLVSFPFIILNWKLKLSCGRARTLSSCRASWHLEL